MKPPISRIIPFSFLFLLAACGYPTPLAQPPVTNTPTLASTTVGFPEITKTGFYWPTYPPKRAYYAGFLADNCKELTGNSDYNDSSYHVGTDILADLDSPVKAISAGTVHYYSHNANWGTDDSDGLVNDGLVIKHYLDDKTVIYAVYGHIRTELREGDPVTAGQVIGNIRMWRYKDEKGVWIRGYDHLHFGIQPGKDFQNPMAWGIMPCPIALPLDPKGYEDPIKFIDNHTPGPVPAMLGAKSTQIFLPTPSSLGEITKEATLTRTPPNPAPTPTPNPTSTPKPTTSMCDLFDASTLDKSNALSVVKYITNAVLCKNAEALSNLISDQGASLGAGYATDFFGYNTSEEVVNELRNAFSISSPKCNGYSIELNKYPDKINVLFEDFKINWPKYNKNLKSEKHADFLMFKNQGHWEIVAILPVPDWALPAFKELKPCPFSSVN